MNVSKTMRDCMNDALGHAIEREIHDACFDIIAFNKSCGFGMLFTMKSMAFLIKGRMYAVIEDLLNSTSLLQKVEKDRRAA